MKVKKFSTYIAEGGQPSADFVAPKDSDKEVKGYQPRAKGEQDFANQHMVQKTDYYAVPGQDHIFNGSVKEAPHQPNNGEKVTKQGTSDVNQPNGGGDSKRTADRSQGDMKPVNPIKEDTQLDELSPELKQRAFDKRNDQLAKDQDDYDRAKAKAGGFDKYDKKSKLSKASDKLDKNKMFKKHDLYKRSLGHHADLDKHGQVRGSDKSAGQKFQDYKDNGGKLSYNQYKARYLKQDFEVEGDLTEGKVMDGLKKIVDKKSAGSVKFENGKTLKVDMTTANAMLNLYKKINDKNKKSMEDKIEKSPEVFMKLMDVAFGGK
jgi:hypothetical protein